MIERWTWFLGIDWGGSEHRFCLLDADGEVRDTRRVAHSAAAVRAALQGICERSGVAPADIAVGLETPRGALVDTVIETGFTVFALNPKQLDRFRDRFTVAGAKDDDRDAQVVADALRTDRRAFRPIRPEDPLVIQLRELSRLVDDLQTDEARLANRLREQLGRVDGAWLTFSPAADAPWLWTVLAESPDPRLWPTISPRRVGAALRHHRIRRLDPSAIVHALRAPRLTVAPGVTDAVALRVRSLVPQLRLLHEQRLASEHRIDQLLQALAEAGEGEPHEHRDVEILRSLPGVGRMVTATMLAEASGLLADRNYPTLRAYAGVAPVTKRSGKRLWVVHMRYACNSRLRDALFHWARTSIQHDAAARTYYDALRARGQHHARALRSVADRWLRILMAMLTTRTLYDPTRPQSCHAAA